MIALRQIGSGEFTELLDTVIGIYTAAMRSPADQLSGRATIMRSHTTYSGFTCVLAERADGEVAGFAYGFHGAPGQWWHDVIHRALADRAGPHVAKAWLSDALEIAEVHVHPDFQSKGIGRSMMHALCDERPERTALLSTHDRPTAARHLYRSLGFVDLLTRFVFPGGYEDYAIVGAELPLR